MSAIRNPGKMKVLVVAPYQGLGELIKQMTPQYENFDIHVIIADMQESLGQIASFGNGDYDVVISRGGTARLLASHSKVPVVEIQVSGFDVLRMLTLMKEYQAKIRLIGFPNIIQSFVSVSNLLDYDFPYTVINDENEVEQALIEAKKDGVQIIVGDTVTVRFANELGMQGVLITSGRESVAEAFRTAELICRSLDEYKRMNRIYDRLLKESGRESAVLDASLNVLFATEGMLSLLVRNHAQTKFPFPLENGGLLELLLRDAASDIRENGPLALYEPAGRVMLTVRLLDIAGGAEYYQLTLEPGGETEANLRVIEPERDMDTFPSFLQTTGFMDEALQNAKRQLLAGEPVTVYGERGTGRRIFAGALAVLWDKNARVIELEIAVGDEAAFLRTCHLLAKAERGALLHIRGFERFPALQQRKLAEKIKEKALKVLFSFGESPKALKSDSRLDAKAFDWLGRGAVELKPLRERLDDLEEYVRTFISAFNEKYGKQIVGVRPDVWDALRAKPWKGNLIELRDTMEAAVREATGEYIERSDVDLPARRSSAPSVAAEGPVFDLNRPLEDIERDIIRYVLEEEGMNQSKAAKRLNINRTTLWRKVKGVE
ncbi:sigma-54-dependent Fis family transcriptional regulator [Cohnella caldifontis]|uniref:sigma-54-dependent Fis family transcriptional regulator n=1 Tax=Cohnella caldifontis TaxID=3027471 RepID=UPI0023EACEBA|nr:sigma-54-dependent Fis family transcriptional regulator [Cohnella sp. YIM B05605]